MNRKSQATFSHNIDKTQVFTFNQVTKRLHIFVTLDDMDSDDKIHFQLHTLEPFHKTVHYKTVSDIKWFKGGSRKFCIQTKMYRLYRKMTINGHFSV